MKPYRIASDPDILKPIIEAMIFASEDPLPARVLARLLVGERDEKDTAEVPPLLTEIESVEPAEEQGDEGEAENRGDAEPDIETVNDVADSMGSHSAESANDLADAMNQFSSSERRLKRDGIDHILVRRLVEELNGEYEESGRAFRIVEVAGGYQFATIREYGEFVAMLSKEKSRRRLSQAALETLSIIAYRQPVSKPEVELIRGVNCDQVLVNLMEKNLVTITGRADAVGRPLLYSTTDEFLRTFGLKGIADLPKLREIEELMEEDAYSAERAEVITITADTEVDEIEARVGAAGHENIEQENDESFDDHQEVMHDSEEA